MSRPDLELPIEERAYPAPFEKMFSLKHIYYIGWLCAQHATYWGLVFSWTTFFGLLRDGMCYKQLLMWLIGFLLFISSAKATYDHFRNDPLMQLSIRTGYVFFAAGMLCTLTAGATSYFYSLGGVDVLPDLGFWAIPQAARGTVLAKVSGLMASVSGISCALRQGFTGDSRLCIRWFRCMAIIYVLRTCTMFLTSLPGPAAHCRGPYELRPTNFWAVMGRMRAMYGGEENCGDLLFSGHTAFVTTSVLTMLHGSATWRPRFKWAARFAGWVYLTTFEYAVIAARKHYSVDVWLGFVVACFVYVVFSESWIPAFFKSKP